MKLMGSVNLVLNQSSIPIHLPIAPSLCRRRSAPTRLAVDFHKETTFLGIEQSHGCFEPRLKRGRSVVKVVARISISPEVYRPISIARGDNIDLFRLDRARPRTASIPVLRSCERLSMNQRRAFAGFVFILSSSSKAHEQTRRLRTIRHGFAKVQLRRRNCSVDPL